MIAKYFRVELFNLAEEDISFESFIKFPLNLFKLIFFYLHPKDLNVSNKSKVSYYGRKSVESFVLLVLILIILQLFAYGMLNPDNFASFAGTVANSCSGVLIGVKIMRLLQQKDNIDAIFKELGDLFLSRSARKSSYRVKKYLEEYLRVAKWVTGFSFLSIFLTFTPPLIDYLIFGAMKPALNYWFPFDIFQRSTFPIALVWTDLAAYFCAILHLGTDLLLFALITVITMEFDFLQLDFKALGKESKSEQSKSANKLIDHHNHLLKLSENLQDIYGPIFLLSFLISSIIACLILFQVLIAESDVSANSFLIPFLIVMVGQNLLLCAFGQKMIDSSTGVADGICSCDWTDFGDEKMRKKIILVIARAQRPMKLSAMRFTDVSLQSYTSVRLTFNSFIKLFKIAISDINNNIFILFFIKIRLYEKIITRSSNDYVLFCKCSVAEM